MRHVIHWPRAAGKTYRLVKLVKETPGGVLITWNADMAEHIRRTYGLFDDQAMSFRQIDKLRGRKIRPILFVDNADYILRDVLGGHEIDGMAINNDCPCCDVMGGREPRAYARKEKR